MIFHKLITKNKCLEFEVFERSWSSLFDFSISISTKSQGRDHWGFYLFLIIWKLKVLEFNMYDIRHQDYTKALKNSS